MLTAILIITGVVFLFYARTLSFTFCIDDCEVAAASDPGKPPKNIFIEIWWAWKGKYYNQNRPLIPHLIHFILHWANCLLVYFAFGHTPESFLAALLFAVAPAGCQGSVWLSGGPYLTSTTCVLLMYLFKPVTPLFYPAAPLFYWASFSWAFSSTFAPIVFLFSPWWWLVFLIPVMAVIKFKHCKKVLKYKLDITPTRTKKLTFFRIVLYFKTLGYYFCLAFIPTRLGVYHDYLYTYGLTEAETRAWEKPDRFFFIGLAVIYVLITNLLWNYNPAVFGLFWFVALISQWCNFPITIQQAVAERYIYLPSIGLYYCLANMIVEACRVNIIPFFK